MPASSLTTILSSFSHLEVLPNPPDYDDRRHTFLLPLDATPRKKGSLHHLSKTDQDKARSACLTLQILFPHEFLLALDILDRGFVTRFVIKVTAKPGGTVGEEGTIEDDDVVNEIFYVQSSSAAFQKSSKSRYKPRNNITSALHYEVRLDSWNCSCPAFTASAFSTLNTNTVTEDSSKSERLASKSENEETWNFGGTTIRDVGRVPSCKHILAAVLVKAAPNLFHDGFTERVVSRDEAAAWAAGWADCG
jgi:hypothetical protein